MHKHLTKFTLIMLYEQLLEEFYKYSVLIYKLLLPLKEN